MPMKRLTLRPGVITQYTPTLAEGTWSSSNLIRWKDGLPQKYGGWQHLTSTPLTGTARGSHAWAALNGNPYLMVGTEQRLTLYTGGALIDVTPLRQTDNVAPSFSTTATSKTVKITDTANGAAAGDWINVWVPVSVGGIIIQGFYQIQSIVDGNNYTITAASAATSTIANGGSVPTYTTATSSSSVTVTLAAHGLSVNSPYTVHVATTVGGVTITADVYTVITFISSSQFTITAPGVATSAATVAENGGNAQLQYLIKTGAASKMYLIGYGASDYGGGDYGGSTSTNAQTVPLRQWIMDNWGQDWVGNYTQGGLYYWTPPQAIENLAVAMPNAPTVNTASFVAMPAQIMVSLGNNHSGTFDPNLIAWSDQSDFTDWTPTAVNQAGSIRIPTGSMIVGGFQGPQQAFIWTDVDLWVMQYSGPPFIFDLTKIGTQCELISAQSWAVFGTSVYWPSRETFYAVNANGLNPLPCPVWDAFYGNLNYDQTDKIFAATNSIFNEIAWFYPSASSSEVDSYVKYNVIENLWDYGSLVRTTWVDHSALGNPISVDGNGILQQHEIGNDADGATMGEFIQSGYTDLDDGTYQAFVERCIPDFKTSTTGAAPSIQISVFSVNYPDDPPIQYGPYTVDQSTKYFIVRSRRRQHAIQIGNSSINTFWRLGAPRFRITQAGRRE